MNTKWKSVGWGGIIALLAGIGGVGVYLGTHEFVSRFIHSVGNAQKMGEVRRMHNCELSIAYIRNPVIEPLVDQVIKDTPAERAGFKVGDLIVAVDEAPVSNFSDVRLIFGSNPGRELTMKVERSGAPVSLLVVPELRKFKDGSGREVCQGAIGIRPKID